MDSSRPEQILDAWKHQVEAGVRAMDTLVAATAKMREVQLGAANETHQRALQLQKALSDATTPQEIWQAQWDWALACSGRSMAYWRGLFEAAGQAGGEIARQAQEETGKTARRREKA